MQRTSVLLYRRGIRLYCPRLEKNVHTRSEKKNKEIYASDNLCKRSFNEGSEKSVEFASSTFLALLTCQSAKLIT